MVIILDEIREMIAMQGGDSSNVHDISEGLVTLKRLMKANMETRKESPKPVEPVTESAEPEVEFETRRSRKKN